MIAAEFISAFLINILRYQEISIQGWSLQSPSDNHLNEDYNFSPYILYTSLNHVNVTCLALPVMLCLLLSIAQDDAICNIHVTMKESELGRILLLEHVPSAKKYSVRAEWLRQSGRAPPEPSETPRWRITPRPASI
jgi:hypothetical protein